MDVEQGDTVQILPHLESECGHRYCPGFNSTMARYIGREVLVHDVRERNIRILEDGGEYSWGPCMFRKVTPTTTELVLEPSGKTKKIDFKGLIDKVGIEFEGYFKRSCNEFSRYERKGLWDGHGDGSLSYGNIDSDEYYEMEYVTKPMQADELSTFIGVIDRHYKNGDYKINKSCGLHFHLSMKNTVVYSSICNADFFYKVVEMFKRNHPAVYNERKRNRYCETDYMGRYGDEESFLRRHFNKESGDRYHAVNFCYREHKTVEVRFYGGSKADITGLAEAIQSVIDIIAEKAHEKQSKKEAIEAPQTSERYNQPLDLLIPSTNAYKRLRAIKIDKIVDRSNNLDLSIKLDKGGEMFIDTDNMRFYRAKKRLVEHLQNSNAWLWDYIFPIYRNVPRAHFSTEAKALGTSEAAENFILDTVIRRMTRLFLGSSRKSVDSYLRENRHTVDIQNSRGDIVQVGLVPPATVRVR